jgi:hypothetical protein
MISPRRETALLAAILACLSAAFGGCAAFAHLVAALSPPKTVKAVFQPSKGKKVLVFVDDLRLNYDPRQPGSSETMKKELTTRLNKEILDNKVARETIPYDRLSDLAGEPTFRRMRIPNIGKRLGADLVVYVEIHKLTLRESPDSPLYRGTLNVGVKIVDVERGRLWPTDRPDKGYAVDYTEPHVSEDLSVTYAVVVTKRLAARVARRVARLFYKHKVPTHLFGKDDEDRELDANL